MAAKQSYQKPVEKHLTEMKELPGRNEVRKEHMPEKAQVEAVAKPVPKEPVVKAKKTPPVESESEEKPTEKDRLITTKEILLGVINVASITLLIVLLIKLPEKAKELNTLRNQVLLSESEVALEVSEVEGSKEKAKELEDLFIDEVGLVNFVSDVEKLKGEASSISKINITSKKAVKDRTGSYGIPVVIEMRGNWTQFGDDINKIQELPYLFRVIRIDTEILNEEGVIGLKYGGFLYVHDKLGEN
jgi:hypothetical protein